MTQSLDELDKKIINELLVNAELTNAHLAVKLNCSEATIRRRRRLLLDNGVIRNAIVADPFSLGYVIMALIGIQIDMMKHEEIETALSQLPDLRFVGVTMGRYDILTEAWFRSTDEMLNFITNVIGKIPGIQRTETLQMMKLVKYGYDWGQTSWDIRDNAE